MLNTSGRVATKTDIRNFVYHDVPGAEKAGWRAVFCAGLEPGAGESVAHYCLEHAADTKGTFGEKLIAIGRMWYLRIETGYQAVRLSSEKEFWELLADEIVDCALADLASHDSRHILINDPPAESRALFETFEHTLDAAMNDAVMRLKVKFMGCGTAYDELAKTLSPENVEAMVKCLHKGYRNGRYLFLGRVEASIRIFDAIAYAVDKSRSAYQHGDRLQVSYCRVNCELVVNHIRDAEFIELIRI